MFFTRGKRSVVVYLLLLLLLPGVTWYQRVVAIVASAAKCRSPWPQSVPTNCAHFVNTISTLEMCSPHITQQKQSTRVDQSHCPTVPQSQTQPQSHAPAPTAKVTHRCSLPPLSNSLSLSLAHRSHFFRLLVETNWSRSGSHMSCPNQTRKECQLFYLIPFLFSRFWLRAVTLLPVMQL